MSLFSFNKNVWLWFHILFGGIGAKVFSFFLQPNQAVGLVFLVAVLWEVFEYTKDDVEKIYGSKKAFFVDAIQDIAGALIMAIVVVL
jgi:hypothetical protein